MKQINLESINNVKPTISDFNYKTYIKINNEMKSIIQKYKNNIAKALYNTKFIHIK